MTPAPGAGSESTKKRRRRKRSANRAPQTQDLKTETPPSRKPVQGKPVQGKPVQGKDRPAFAKRVDEVSAGGLVIDFSGTQGLLIGRID